jgi:hypothetical protein
MLAASAFRTQETLPVYPATELLAFYVASVMYSMFVCVLLHVHGLVKIVMLLSVSS